MGMSGREGRPRSLRVGLPLRAPKFAVTPPGGNGRDRAGVPSLDVTTTQRGWVLIASSGGLAGLWMGGSVLVLIGATSVAATGPGPVHWGWIWTFILATALVPIGTFAWGVVDLVRGRRTSA